MPVRFLSARWSHLVLLNYAVPEGVLKGYLPPGCVADTSLGGRAYVSLVAFDFLDCRVFGVPWPGFRNFPEVNLRAYVRHEASGDRGVVFVRELVPSRFVALMARATYNEPYMAAEMASRVETRAGRVNVAHEVKLDGHEYTVSVQARPEVFTPEKSSVEQFFKEHRWGFNKSHGGKLIRYEVAHPTWRCFPVESYELTWNFERMYGPPWGILTGARPDSIVLAEGSGVEVFVWKSV